MAVVKSTLFFLSRFVLLLFLFFSKMIVSLFSVIWVSGTSSRHSPQVEQV